LLLRHARPSWSVVAGRNRVLERLRSVTSSRVGSRIEEAPATPFPQTGDRLWRVGRLPEMGSVTWRWKAPRVRLSASTFAGRRAKRPLPGAPAAAGTGTHGWRASAGVRGEPWEARATASPAKPSFPDGIRHGSRHGVLESIGSGQSSSRERSRWERSRRGTAMPSPTTRPLTGGNSAGQLARARGPSAARNVLARVRPPGE